MKTKLAAIRGMMLLSSAAFANHGSLTTDSVIGGALGGALGGFFGAEMGGRDGAIIGSGVGAALGTAYTTRDYRHRHHRPHRRSVRMHRHYVTPYPRHHAVRHHHYYYGHPRGRSCPPGLAMQGRCW